MPMPLHTNLHAKVNNPPQIIGRHFSRPRLPISLAFGDPESKLALDKYINISTLNISPALSLNKSLILYVSTNDWNSQTHGFHNATRKTFFRRQEVATDDFINTGISRRYPKSVPFVEHPTGKSIA